MTVRVVPAEMAHVPLVAARARQADRDELWAGGRITAFDALAVGVESSTSAWTGFAGDDPICLFGVAPASLLGGIGIPWLIGTDEVERHQMAFLRRCQPHVATMRSVYDTLVNWVDDRNVVAQRWLRWLGFHVEPPAPFGPDGMPFRRFIWRRADV